MNELISGKEALIVLANGGDVLYINTFYKEKPTRYWGDAKECTVEQFFNGEWIFKIKPRTITLNNIKVPAPFEPKEGENFWHLYPPMGRGYNFTTSNDSDHYEQFGAWRTEEEIKQVVAALRKIFVINNQ
ncbi:MAG: hypothetical protein RSE18_13515 [Acinetobacter sp.]